MNDAWCEALFASLLQPSDSPTAGMAAEAANWTLRQLGVRACAGRMAQEFGDHPDAAASRMRWARQLALLLESSRDCRFHCRIGGRDPYPAGRIPGGPII